MKSSLYSFKPDASHAGSKWLVFKSRPSAARLRLFCLPYAGGTAAIYNNWASKLNPIVEVCAIQLPGRADRLSEPPLTSVEEVVSILVEEMSPYLARPFAIFGHSMGALIGFELCRELMKRRMANPEILIVSGRQAPQLPSDKPVTFDLPKAEFLKELRRLKGTPAEVLSSPELMELLLPALRGDFQLIQTYRYSEGPPLQTRITAFGGSDDLEVDSNQLDAWREQTSGPFVLHTMPGGHFFLHECEKLLLRTILQELRQLHERTVFTETR